MSKTIIKKALNWLSEPKNIDKLNKVVTAGAKVVTAGAGVVGVANSVKGKLSAKSRYLVFVTGLSDSEKKSLKNKLKNKNLKYHIFKESDNKFTCEIGKQFRSKESAQNYIFKLPKTDKQYQIKSI